MNSLHGVDVRRCDLTGHHIIPQSSPPVLQVQQMAVSRSGINASWLLMEGGMPCSLSTTILGPYLGQNGLLAPQVTSKCCSPMDMLSSFDIKLSWCSA